MSDYQVRVAVLIAAIQRGKVVLARRANTTYMDGFYGLPGGHVESQETLKNAAERELFEETGLSPGPKGLQLFHVYQNISNPERPYVGFVFLAENCLGKIRLEKAKADDIQLFDLDKLPPKTIPYHREAIMNATKTSPINISYVLKGN